MTDALAYYPADWVPIGDGKWAPLSLVKAGRTKEWTDAMGRGEIVECPEIRRVVKITNIAKKETDHD